MRLASQDDLPDRSSYITILEVVQLVVTVDTVVYSVEVSVLWYEREHSCSVRM